MINQKHFKLKPVLSFNETIEFVGSWYNQYYKDNSDAVQTTHNQLNDYIEYAKKQNISWTL